MKRLLFAGLCLLSFAGIGDVLMWQVDESIKVDGSSIQQFLVPYPSDDDHFPAARVKVVDGSTSRILKIWYDNPDDPPSRWEDGDWGIEPCYTGSGRWETGIVQSETGYNTIGRIQDQFNFDDIIQNKPDVAEVLFIMELGYNIWDDNVGEYGDYVWTTLAESAPELYQNLVNQHMYASGDIAPPMTTPWTPDFYTTPEPSSLYLILVGTGLLMLKRKKLIDD